MNKNNLILFSRAEKVELDSSQVEKCLKAVARPTWDEFERAISPIWFKVLNGPGVAIKDVFYADSVILKELYENFFVNGLSDGAAIGSKMYQVRSYLKILRREKKRFNELQKIKLKENISFNYDLPDFGQPWKMKLGGSAINFELTDHFYFADMSLKILKAFDIRDVIFLGDGCGYLCQALLHLDRDNDLKNVIMIDLYHFLVRQYLLMQGSAESVSIEYLNGERDNYPTTSSIKALVNQDSFPEINKEGQDKYFSYMRNNNVKLLVSYNKVDPTNGHEEFRNRADAVFSNKLLCVESAMRPGYWIEVWHS